MKKLKTTVKVLFLSVIAATTANAQGNLVAHTYKQLEYVPAATIETIHIEESGNSVAVSAQARKNFTRDFAVSNNAVWQKTDNGFVVRFNKDGIRNTAFLTKRGNCYVSMREYTEKELPADVRKQVKNAFYTFEISSVQEVRQYNTTAYVVMIADASSWKVVRVMDGELDVLNEYAKG
jgi:hypothetical protein